MRATLLRHDGNPHFKVPAPQGWAYAFYQREAARLEKDDVACSRRSRRSGCAEPPPYESFRLRAVCVAVDRLCAEVMAGSELLYDGIPAVSLDGQLLAAAIAVHLACPSISEVGGAPRWSLRGCGPLLGARWAHVVWADQSPASEGCRGAVSCVAIPRVLACNT